MKILFLDDEPDIVTLIKIATRLTPTVALTTETSSQKALKRLENEKFDVLVTDVMMSAPTGPDVVREVRSDIRHDDMDILFATAATDPDQIEYLRSLGACGVIGKPFNPLEFVNIVKDAIVADTI